MRAIGERLARAWQAVPVRLPGLVVLGAGLYAAFRLGKREADYLLFPAGLVAVALVAVSLLCVALGAYLLWRSVRRAPSGLTGNLDTTVSTPTAFRFARFAAWPFVEVKMRWEQPGDVSVEVQTAGRAYAETVTARERGRHARVVRRFTVEDVFGLTAISFRVTWDEPLRIAPAAAAATAELATSYAHGDSFSHPAGRQEGDLVEMRAYGHGDPLRHVLWKTFARTRRLLVRMPERAIAPQPITVAFLVAGPGDEPTAATARLYLERGVFGPDFLFSADGAARPTRDTHEAVDQIIDSVAARAHGGASLDALASQVEATRLATCVVFAPPVDGPWRERVTAFIRRLPAPATIVIGVAGAADGARRSRMGRLLWRAAGDDDPDSRALAKLPALRAALEADGLRVQVLHRETGLVP
ncbi:MAG TPA: DUF58 domain-containing protein [Haliangiales bacterium]|nr:DUF58 domain-containing protein [Haliangiales bacterium]